MIPIIAANNNNDLNIPAAIDTVVDNKAVQIQTRLMLLQLTAANIECKSTFEQTPGGRVKNDHVPANRTEPPPPSPSSSHPLPLTTLPHRQHQTFILPDRLMNVFAHSFYVRLHVNTTKKIQTLVKLVYLLLTPVKRLYVGD